MLSANIIRVGNLLKIGKCNKYIREASILNRTCFNEVKQTGTGVSGYISRRSRPDITHVYGEGPDPTARGQQDELETRLQSKECQLNPCDLPYLVHTFRPYSREQKEDLYRTLDREAKDALADANTQMSLYTDRVHNMTTEMMHSHWGGHLLPFLPQRFSFPFVHDWEIAEDEKRRLKYLNYPCLIANVYNGFQKIAMGLEQVIWDQEEEKLPSRPIFKSAADIVHKILCELFTEIINCQLELSVPRILLPDVQRDDMPDDIRYLPQGVARDIRDYLIIREYYNGLNYMRLAFRTAIDRPDSVWEFAVKGKQAVTV